MISIRIYIGHVTIMIAKPYRAFESFCETFRSCSIDFLQTGIVFLRNILRQYNLFFLHALFNFIIGNFFDGLYWYAYQAYAYMIIMSKQIQLNVRELFEC